MPGDLTKMQSAYDIYLDSCSRAIKHLTVANLVLYDGLTIYKDPVLVEIRDALAALNDKLVDRFNILKKEFGKEPEVGYDKKETQETNAES